MTTTLLLSILTAAVTVAGQTNWTVGQTVQTSSGAVRGHAAALTANVSEYLGIPFAQPPVGNLRFAAPAPIANSNQTINGTNFGFSCLGSQIYPLAANATGLTPAGREIYNEWNQVGDKFSEDCLTLNVWTKPQTGEAKKAVLVWLYGGGFFTGGTSAPLYNGKTFADEQDVIVVSVNCELPLRSGLLFTEILIDHLLRSPKHVWFPRKPSNPAEPGPFGHAYGHPVDLSEHCTIWR